MFGPRLGLTGFNIAKIATGLSKTLGVVNRIIPIYKESMPMIDNAKKAFNKIKEFSNNKAKDIVNNSKKNIKPLKEKINTIKSVNSNNPTFFQ